MSTVSTRGPSVRRALWLAMAGAGDHPPLSNNLSESGDCIAGLPKGRDRGPEVSEACHIDTGLLAATTEGLVVHPGQLRCKAPARCKGSRILLSKGSDTSCWEPSGLRPKMARLLASPYHLSLLERDMASGKGWGPTGRTRSPELH